MRAPSWSVACAVVALVVASVIQSDASNVALAASPDGQRLKTLLDQRSCDHWPEISSLARDQLRARGSSSLSATDMNLIEQAFLNTDFCAKEMQKRLDAAYTVIRANGVSQGGSPTQARAKVDAAVIAFYSDAYMSQEPPSKIKSWSSLVAARDISQSELPVLIDSSFGQGRYAAYMAAKGKGEKDRTSADQETIKQVGPWVDPP